MKSAPSTFQLIVIVVFILLGIVGVVVFAGLGGVNNKTVPTATIWGTVDAPAFNEMLRLINAEQRVLNVTYIQKAPERFQEEFVNALAEGTGPDIVLLSDDLLYSQSGKLMVIPYTTIDQRTYSDTYLNAADYFMNAQGIFGIPFTVDPIVMYYNRSMLATGGIAEAPKSWKQVEELVPKVTKINETKGIVKAGVALGEARNVNNAKEIVATMLMQAGNPITQFDPGVGAYKAVLDAPGEQLSAPADAVIRFYTQFSNPTNPLYSWSRSMPSSKQAFLAGDLALYFGYASEYTGLRLQNPNLDFDVAQIPQNSSNFNVTYGKVTAFAITKRPANAQDAMSVILKLTEQNSQKIWVELTKMPPVRKDVLSSTPADKYLSVFYRSAIQARSWTDPDPVYSAVIFRDMIEGVTTGLILPSEAVTTAKQRLDLLLQGFKS